MRVIIVGKTDALAYHPQLCYISPSSRSLILICSKFAKIHMKSLMSTALQKLMCAIQTFLEEFNNIVYYGDIEAENP